MRISALQQAEIQRLRELKKKKKTLREHIFFMMHHKVDANDSASKHKNEIIDLKKFNQVGLL